MIDLFGSGEIPIVDVARWCSPLYYLLLVFTMARTAGHNSKCSSIVGVTAAKYIIWRKSKHTHFAK